MGQSQQGVWDGGIAMRLAAMVVAALVVVFVIQRLGFRFVVAVG